MKATKLVVGVYWWVEIYFLTELQQYPKMYLTKCLKYL